jgi:CheY-like chemotaxis protein
MTAGTTGETAREAIRVLLVEDAPIDAELVLRQMKRHGLVVESKRVSNEADFRAALLAFAPDLVLSDYAMPQFSGSRALEVRRELAPHVPFVFVSGSVRPQDAITARAEGAADFVMKDDLSRLGPAIDQLLAEARLRRP